MNLKLHHIAIICSDYEKSKEFYLSALGFSVINEQYRKDKNSYKLDIRLNDIQIELFTFENPPKRPSYPEACGLRHVAFGVDDINETVISLNKKNIEVEPIRTDENTGRKFTFIKDPDGLPIEFYEN